MDVTITDIVDVKPEHGWRWVAANVLVVVVTVLSVLLSVARADGDLLGGGLVVLLVLWLVYDLWLKWFGGHSRRWLDSLVAFTAALGLSWASYSAARLATDPPGPIVPMVDGLVTVLGTILFVGAVAVEIHRIGRDRTRAQAVAD